ncbi:MAG TPA: hypothetical protein VFS43_03285 [Polyangiaceae bacterium]|nr:hypothetical protein [Polyangiaceae bacterium]
MCPADSALGRPTLLSILTSLLVCSLASACASSSPPPEANAPAPGPDPAPATTAPAAPAPPPAPTTGPGDQMPEPAPPDQECVWRPHVRCQKASGSPPPAAAPPPYGGCATEIPALPENASREVRVARLSPNSTRAARKADPQACCYIEFILQSCR